MPKTEGHPSVSQSTLAEFLTSSPLKTQSENKDCDGKGTGETAVLFLLGPCCNYLFYCLPLGLEALKDKEVCLLLSPYIIFKIH